MKNNTPCKKLLMKLNLTQSQLAKLLKLDRSTVCRWDLPRNRGGRGGIIPQRNHKKIKAIAARKKILLEPGDLYE